MFILAALCMLGSSAMFSLMNSFIRLLSESMHSSLIVSWRNLMALALLLPIAAYRGFGTLRTRRLKGHFWRGLVGMFGMQLWTYCIVTIDLNVATALSFTAPLFACLFAVIFLHEKADHWRWLALFAGFIGTLIIIRPGMGDFSSVSLVVLFTTSLWATTGLLVKSLTRTEPPFRIVFLMTVFMTIFSLPFAVHVFRLPNADEFLLILCVAVTSLAAHFLQVQAYSMASVVSLMPFDFTRLLFTSIFAYLFFSETLDEATFVGGLIVLISAISIARRDARMRAPSSIPRA